MSTTKRKIEFSLSYNRSKKLNKNGTALIHIKAYQGRAYRYFSTNIWVRPDQWDEKNKRIKANHPNQYVFNTQIYKQLQEMEAYVNQMINRYGSFPLDRLHEYSIPISNVRSFTEFFKEELQDSTIKADSLKPQRTTFNKLCEFRNPVFFEDLTYSFITAFDRFLHKQKLNPNTIHRHHKTMKKFIRLTIVKDQLDANADPYKKFRAKSVEPERVFLTDKELQRIEQLTFPEELKHLERIQDIFLAACYTGLRFSDVTKIKLSDLSETSDGLVLNVKASKTEKFAQFFLSLLFPNPDGSSKPEQLFRRYVEIRQHERLGVDEPLFGSITNQYLNRELKVLAARAGIKKRISSHTGRRTNATILAGKISMPALQKHLQHSSLDMTKIYIALSNEDIKNELKKAKW